MNERRTSVGFSPVVLAGARCSSAALLCTSCGVALQAHHKLVCACASLVLDGSQGLDLGKARMPPTMVTAKQLLEAHVDQKEYYSRMT